MKQILVRAPNWIGDAVLARDFFAGLRAAYPRSTIVVACPVEMESLFYAETAPPFWDEVLPLTRAQRKFPSGISFWRRLAARRFDLAVSLPSSLSAALLLRLTGAPVRIGYADPGAAFFLTSALPWKGRDSGKHKSELYRDLLSLLGAVPKPSAPSPRSASTSSQFVFAPGASIALREWPGFTELAQRLLEKFPDSVIRIVGTPAQQEWENRFAGLADPRIESFIGLTTLAELVELCRESRFVVANDSGVAHLAATLAGAPTVVLFGPGDPRYVAPLGAQVKIARAEGVPCSPCESARCHGRYGYQQCLRSLSVEEVLRQISALS